MISRVIIARTPVISVGIRRPIDRRRMTIIWSVV